jgi:Tfp pilus assembly PilM family ATPase
MPKHVSSAIGVDLGRHTLKAVTVARRGQHQVAITNYSTRVVTDLFANPEQLQHQVRLLLREVDAGTRPCGVVVSGLDSMTRIIEQPPTPPKLLREGLRLNGQMLLNQDCQHFVLDCDYAKSDSGVEAGAPMQGPNLQPRFYLVAGLPRPRVQQISDAFLKNKNPISVLQVAPVAFFNAFDYSYPEVAGNEAFVLLDIGHQESTVLIGCRRELVLVRTIDFGGQSITDSLAVGGAIDRYAAITLLQQGDAGVIELLSNEVSTLAREVSASIGFFEGQREETVRRVFVSGGPATADALLQVLSDSLDMTCELWDPFARCLVNLSKAKAATLLEDLINLPAAFGAGLAALDS